jgi:hypothetical protein
MMRVKMIGSFRSRKKPTVEPRPRSRPVCCPAQQSRIGEAVDEADNQQRRPFPKSGPLAKLLRSMDFAGHHACHLRFLLSYGPVSNGVLIEPRSCAISVRTNLRSILRSEMLTPAQRLARESADAIRLTN